jgi:hypothetical protein
MKKKSLLVVFLSLLLLVVSFSQVFAVENPKKDLGQQDMATLTRIKFNIETVIDLQKRGIISDKVASEEKQFYLAQAEPILGKSVDAETLIAHMQGQTTQNVQSQSSVFDKIKGYLTFINIVLFLAAILIVLGASWIFYLYVWPFVREVPIVLYEILAYGTCIALMYFGLGMQNGVFVALLGCLGLIGGIILTFNAHEEAMKSFFKKMKVNEMSFVSLVLCIIWSIVAILYSSKMIGFMSVMALEAFLGFSVAVMPLCYAIGFKDEDAIPRAMGASFIILASYVAMRMTGYQNQYLEIFSTGALFMGTFVYFIGLLIVSCKYYRSNNFVFLQILTIASGVAALFLGSVWGITQLQSIGGTFFFLYLLEKYIEIIKIKEHWAWGTFGLGLILFLSAMFMKAHPQYFLIGL